MNINLTLLMQAVAFFAFIWFCARFIWPPLMRAVDAKDSYTHDHSERLAEMAGVNAAKVRKDLSYLGSYGTRGVGYDVEYLLFQMSRELGLTKDWPVAIVGVGYLFNAIL